ncbi:glycosyltransferase family 39 protein [Candidatus Woesearchaeota archaeon]|nr:glycosyltransferase family 39 protein [Candidatus Woesearchaeota archaeon]
MVRDKGYVAIVLVMALLAPIFLTTWIHGVDGVGHYVYLRSFLIDGDFDFTNEYAHYTRQFSYIKVRINELTNKPVNQYSVGTALLWLPFFTIGHLAAVLLGYPADGYSPPYVAAISIGTLVLGAIGLLLAYDATRRFTSTRIAVLAVLGVLFSTSAFFYLYLDPSLSHGASIFAVSLFLWYWLRTGPERSIRQWGLLGLIAGLMVMVRVLDGVFLLVPLFEAAHKYAKMPSVQLFRKHVLFIIAMLVVFVPQFLAWNALFGSPIAGPGYGVERGFDFSISTMLQMPRVWFSDFHGLFSWTPVVLLGIIGLWWYAKKSRQPATYFAIAFLVLSFVVNSWWAWYGGQSFGNRLFLGMTFIFVLGLAAVLEKLSARVPYWALCVMVTMFAAWNFGLMAQYGLGMIPAEAPVSISTIAYNNIAVIPGKIAEILSKLASFWP